MPHLQKQGAIFINIHVIVVFRRNNGKPPIIHGYYSMSLYISLLGRKENGGYCL